MICLDINLLKNQMKKKDNLIVLTNEITRNPQLIGNILAIIRTEKGSIKYTGTKLIRLVSQTNPIIIYPYFDDIFALIYNINSFIKWDAITIISNLITVDNQSKFDLLFNQYFNLLHDKQMITAANVVVNAWKIVRANPKYEFEITSRLLMIPNNQYYSDGVISPECNKILCGHVIDCFSKYFELSALQNKIIDFANMQRESPRKSVAKKASTFLNKIVK